MVFKSLFKKKYNLSKSGFFTGFTDIHTHLLPGVDDGFSSEKESIAALLGLQDLGFSQVVFTPHVMSDLQKNVSSYLSENYHSFISRLPEELQIKCRLGAEYMLDEVFIAKHLQDNQLLPLGKKNLLVETSQIAYTYTFKESLYEILLAEYHPILAHPERYCQILKWKNYVQLKEQGYSFQLNLMSLSGQYGPMVRTCAESLLQNNMYEFIGTDIHRLSTVSNLASLTLHSAIIDKLQLLSENNHRLYSDFQ